MHRSLTDHLPTDELVAEQRHLDASLARLRQILEELERPVAAGADAAAGEALAHARAARRAALEDGRGPLIFGSLVPPDGPALHVGRHAVADERQQLLVVGWRAP